MTEEKEYPPLAKTPAHVAIIMDGNGRWATSRGLPRLAGHRAGTENLRRIIRSSVSFGVKYLTLYAFSTENWNRPQDEIHGLLHILEDVIDRELDELNREGVRLLHIGHLEHLNKKLAEKVQHAMDLTCRNDRLVVNLAFSYGGRDEIICAVRKMIADGIDPDKVDEALISSYLFTAGTPDPDLIIRTSGEYRVSNFLIWQGAYAEWYFTPTLWPDFDKDEFYKALDEYGKRDRRFGRVNTSKSGNSTKPGDAG
jgi:undecaprenyl diphosphate synthase